MKAKPIKVWGIILIVLGFLVFMLYFLHRYVGLIGGGLGLVLAGVSLLNIYKKKNR